MKKIITLFSIICIVFSCKNTSKEKSFATKVTISEEKDTEKPIEIIKYVAAKNGLNFRDKPKGKVLQKFDHLTQVTIVEKTGVIQEIIDENQKITGEWVGVKHHDKVVYVFDAFLADPKKDTNEKELINPIDAALLQAYIIIPGEYHGDEIPDKMTTQNWFGLFNEDGVYSVKKAPITISKVHDAIVDEKGTKTGKKIAANNAESCFLLMNNISYLTEREIDTILTKSKVIHPENPYTFQFKNIEYTLSATAKTYGELKKDYFRAEGYKLYLEKSENGTTSKQLLLFEKYFDDQIIRILFIGDIDGDEIPDILLDSSNHYNSMSPTLYLSKEADNENILKIVSIHNSVGC